MSCPTKAEPNHRNTLADLRVRLPDAVKAMLPTVANAPASKETVSGRRTHEVRGNVIDVRVYRVATTRARNAVA